LERTLGPTVRINLDIDQQAACVVGDETQVELAVLNLAINARDAMPEGGGLTIATRIAANSDAIELPPGRYVELAVTDTGTGMPPEVADRAFNPFFTTKGIGAGTGLGLSQVYAMARQAGGIARIRSAPGEGTTVSMILPLTEFQPEASQPGAARQENRAKTATILVIDDDPDVQRFLADSLDGFGYAVVQAKDGPTGLEALARSTPDLVILDYAMPGLTGAEVAQTIGEKNPHLPIIFASGYAETSAIDEAGERRRILRKPFRLDELQEAVFEALQGAAAKPRG